MADTVTPEVRSRIMSRIRGKDTKPELLLRKALWAAGIRGYRIHPKKIPGRPDIAFVGKKVAVFVDGCFWHGCPLCYREPRSNRKYWANKLAGNMARDMQTDQLLAKDGWVVFRCWEHQVLESSDVVVASIRALCLSRINVGIGLRDLSKQTP